MAPEWMGSEGAWFLALNAVVVAIAFLSRARPSLTSPRRGGVTRRASSVMLQRLRSFTIFSYPSACLSYLLPDAAATSQSQETQQEKLATSPINKPSPSPRALVVHPSPPAAKHVSVEEEEEDDEEGDPNAMSMDEAYALVVASRHRPEHEREAEARRSEVDAKAKEFIEVFNDDQRQRRLNSIFNYTQMLKQQALSRGRGRGRR